MKIITRYGFLILSVVLIAITLIEYINYRQLLVKIDKEDIPIDVWFNGWDVTLSFLLMSFYEFLIKNNKIKLLLRILLITLFLAVILKNVIPFGDFYSGIENIAVIFGIITIILLLVLGFKKVFNRKT